MPLHRIVKRIGSQLRGTLGGWLLPLTRIDKALQIELLLPNFPYKFPETTTGKQALEYIQDVWQRAESSPEGLANEVRDVLPTAYAYCLADCEKNVSLAKQWAASVSKAMVFADREWIALDNTDDIYFDDLADRRFLPSGVELKSVTGGYLGNSTDEQLRTSTALGLQTLSSCIEMVWQHGTSVTTDWSFRFRLICDLLRHVRGGEQTTRENEHYSGLSIDRVETLNLAVRVGDTNEENVPVNARLHDGRLTVMGKPVQFGADATKELLRYFSFSQRGDLAADLTGMLGAIDREEDFLLAVQKFMRSFAQDFELTTDFQSPPQEAMDGQGTAVVDNREDLSAPNGGHEIPRVAPTPEYSDSPRSNASFTRDRALSRQRALAKELKISLKGEVVPDNENYDAKESRTPTRDAIEASDEIYRKVAAQYERESGRKPELGTSNQQGWDLRSADPNTGSERLIEVKGKGCPWINDEVVELSRAQVREAFKALDEAYSWYLYVIERLDDGTYQVLPIPNPIATAADWILNGQSWRMMADSEDVRCITLGNEAVRQISDEEPVGP